MKFKLIRGNQKPPIRLQIDFLVICHFPVWSRRVHREPMHTQLPGLGASGSGSSPPCGLRHGSTPPAAGSEPGQHPAWRSGQRLPGAKRAPPVANGDAESWGCRQFGVVPMSGICTALLPRASHAQSSGPGLTTQHGRLLPRLCPEPKRRSLAKPALPRRPMAVLPRTRLRPPAPASRGAPAVPTGTDFGLLKVETRPCLPRLPLLRWGSRPRGPAESLGLGVR